MYFNIIRLECFSRSHPLDYLPSGSYFLGSPEVHIRRRCIVENLMIPVVIIVMALHSLLPEVLKAGTGTSRW